MKINFGTTTTIVWQILWPEGTEYDGSSPDEHVMKNRVITLNAKLPKTKHFGLAKVIVTKTIERVI